MLSQKLLVDVGVDMFAGENRCVADKYRCFLVLFRGDGGVAWAFACKMCLVSKSSGFKFGEYGRQSAKNQNSANGC
jgi:hypothetical protein